MQPKQWETVVGGPLDLEAETPRAEHKISGIN